MTIQRELNFSLIRWEFGLWNRTQQSRVKDKSCKWTGLSVTGLCVCVWECETHSFLFFVCFPVARSCWLTLGGCISAMEGGITVTPPRGDRAVAQCLPQSERKEMLTHTRCYAHTHAYSTRSERDPFKEKAPLSPERWVEQRQCPEIQKYKYIHTFTHCCCGCMPKWVLRFSQDCELDKYDPATSIHTVMDTWSWCVNRDQCDILQCYSLWRFKMNCCDMNLLFDL